MFCAPRQFCSAAVPMGFTTVDIGPKRAKVSCNAVVHVQSDGPIAVRLLGCSNPKIVMAKN